MDNQASLHPYSNVVFIGRSPMTLLLACFVAKAGKRVLVLDQETPLSEPPTPHCPVAMEMLKQLNLSPTQLAPQSIQIVTPAARLDICGTENLAREFQRELPQEADEILDCLTQWDQWGQQFQELLRQIAPPTGNLKKRLSFHWAVLQNLPYRSLRISVAQSLRDRFSDDATQVLSSLIGGLTGAPIQRLSVAEAALAWHTFITYPAMDTAPLMETLEHRLHQLHGQLFPLGRVDHFERATGNWRIHWKEGNPIRTETLFLGVKKQTHLFRDMELVDPSSRIETVLLSSLEQDIPPTLGDRIALSTSFPAVLTLEEGDTPPFISFAGVTAPGDAQRELEQALHLLFPYAPPRLSSPLPTTTGVSQRLRLLQTGKTDFLRTEGLYQALPDLLFPHLPGINTLLTARLLAPIFR